jgi:hypothetical protein
MAWVFANTTVTVPGERLVLLALANHADAEGRGAFPSKKTIGEETCIHPDHVRKVLRRLEGYGVIQPIGTSPYGTTVYRIVMGEASEGEANRLGRQQHSQGEATESKKVTPMPPKPSYEPSTQTVIADDSQLHPLMHDDADNVIAILNNMRTPRSRRIDRKAVVEIIERHKDIDAVTLAGKMANYYERPIGKVVYVFQSWMEREAKRPKQPEVSDGDWIKERMGWD